MKQISRRRMSIRLLACSALVCVSAIAFADQPSIALFYGDNPPWDELHAFDVVVVEPEDVPDPKPYITNKTSVFAYVSVGEVEPTRRYFKEIPAAWKLGMNSVWGSVVLDQAQPEWPEFFVDKIIKPLWDAGYRGFLFDTLDSYQIFAKTDEQRVRQEAGMVALVRAVKARYPEARLIFNRGFEILPEVHQDVFVVAAESLFQQWDQVNKEYQPVGKEEHDWLLGQLQHVKNDYGIPVLSIEYVAPKNRALARKTADQVRALGFIPWVTNGALDMMGLGLLEVMPRKVMMIQNSADTVYDLENTNDLRYATMPLNYLGLVAQYIDARKPLPTYPLTGRYAGIVVMLDKAPRSEGPRLAAWLRTQIAAGVPVVILGEGEFLFSDDGARGLGLDYSPSVDRRTRLHIVHKDRIVGFEAPPDLDRGEFFQLHASEGNALLTLADAHGDEQDAIALMPWGGYALNPDVLVQLPTMARPKGQEDSSVNSRWVINPIEFLRLALKLPEMPVPDVTTESGNRMLMIHMDGDGFADKGEFPGFPYAADMLYDRILKKYPFPETISVIEGEVAPIGIYPKRSPDMERIARKIFALSHVEIASHSFSHPFDWRKAEAEPADVGPANDLNRLNVPHYAFNPKTEVLGSVAYINSQLAPPGKQVKTFLWTGDCDVGSDVLALAYQAGLANMNGGDTQITRTNPSLSLAAPLGVQKGDYFQVYAPDQNEMIYTNDWKGPFYGYERAIETFELTDRPYRIKPIDIYFHTYSGSKPASLRALDKVFRWAQQQSTTPVYVSQYVHKVLDFNHMVVARTHGGWLVRGNGAVHELRAPTSMGEPDLDASSVLAGFNRHDGNQYLHFAGNEARISFLSPGAHAPAPFLVSANARIGRVERVADPNGRALTLALHGNVPLDFMLAVPGRCSVHAAGKLIHPDGVSSAGSHFSLRKDDVDELRAYCPR